MSDNNRTELDAMMANIEEMWAHLEVLFEDLDANGRWDEKHGPDWTHADVPYHLAYCNRDVVAYGLEQGANYPDAEQEVLASPQALGAWNEKKFAQRPAGQTPAESVAQWRSSIEDIRRLTGKMNDDDLKGPFFMPIFAGWATPREGLGFCVNHDYSEFTQLRIFMGRAEPLPSPNIVHDYLGTMLNFFPMVLNREAAVGQEFSVVMAFTDPGVGAWTIQVGDGSATIVEGVATEADLVITQSSETFEKAFRGIQDPAEAMQSGAVQVSNFESMATFGRLFPM